MILVLKNQFKTVVKYSVISSLLISSYAFSYDDKYLANGYWLQKDKDTNANVSVVHVYEPKKDYVSARMYVPLSFIPKNTKKIEPPMVVCEKCGKGNAYGHEYDYSSGKEKYQGLEFAWETKKSDQCKPGSEGPVYDTGSVLNPNDGKYYHLKAQTLDDGDKISVRAYMGWLGRTEYWERVSEEQANKIKDLCGLTDDDVYPYEDKDRKVINQKLFEECSTRDFIKNPL